MEIGHRMAKARRNVGSLRRLILNTQISIRRRLRLFDATVGSTAVWCAQSWTPRTSELRLLQTTRNAMLRRIVGCHRGPDEQWLEWVKRTTRKAVSFASAAKVRNWVCEHSRSKLSWAGHVARAVSSSWISRVNIWRDAEWNCISTELGLQQPKRPSRRGWMKRKDVLRRYTNNNMRFILEAIGQPKIGMKCTLRAVS